MKDLPIRKVPGIGRVTERLLDSIGIKVKGVSHLSHLVKRSHEDQDMWRCECPSCRTFPYGQRVWYAVAFQRIPRHWVQCSGTMGARGEKEHWRREVCPNP